MKKFNDSGRIVDMCFCVCEYSEHQSLHQLYLRGRRGPVASFTEPGMFSGVELA